jgi:hypothetical protein
VDAVAKWAGTLGCAAAAGVVAVAEVVALPAAPADVD